MRMSRANSGAVGGVWSVMLALAATGFWAALVRWRTSRQRAALWKSLALPAGGAVWCWMLLMTLWLPLLDYTQGYATFARKVAQEVDKPGCVAAHGLGASQIAALQWYGKLPLVAGSALARCDWLLADPTASGELPPTVDTSLWSAKALIRHPADASDAVWLLQRR